MRSSSAAWTAALAVMSMHGPLTMAEAAPAHHYDQERPQYYPPKHFRRGGYNSSAPAVESTLSEGAESETSTSSVDDTTIPPVPFADETTTHTKRTRTSTRSHPSDDELLSSFLAEGLLPMTANTVVTTTMTVERNKLRFPETDTYTITYTETSSPVPTTTSTTSEMPEYTRPVPLVTSVSIPSDTSVVPVPEPSDTTTTTKSHRRTKQHHTEEPTTSTSSMLVESSPYPAGNSSVGFFPTAHSSSSSVFYSEPYSSSAAPSSDGLFGILGGTGNIAPTFPHLTGDLGKPTTTSTAESTGRPHRTHKSETKTNTDSLPTGTGGIPIPNVVPHLGETDSGKPKAKTTTTTRDGLFGTESPLFGTNGILPTDEPLPTAAPELTNTHTRSKDSTSSDGHLIVGLSTAISLPASPSESLLNPHLRPQPDDKTTSKSGLLDGLTGVPTGIPTGLIPSDLPSESTGSELPLETPKIIQPFADPTGESPKRPNNEPNPSGIPQIEPSGLVTDLTKGIPSMTGGVFPPSGSAAPTGTDGALPLVSDVTSVLTGLTAPTDASEGTDTATGTGLPLVDTLTGVLPSPTGDAPSIVNSLTGALPTLTSDATLPLPDASSSPSNPSDAPQVIPEIIPSGGVPLNTPTSLTLTAGDATITVPLPSNTAVTSGESPLGVPGVTVPTETLPAETSPTDTVPTDTSPTDTASVITTPSDTYPTQPTTTSDGTATPDDSASSIPAYESPSTPATSTSIGLDSPTTVPVGSTGAAPSSYVEPTPPASSEVPSESSNEPTSAAGYTEQSTGSPEPSTTLDTASPTAMGPTIHPTGTDTYTSLTLPETWTFAPTTTRTNDLATAGPSAVTSVPSGLPTYMPQYVQPPGGMPRAPTNATLVQIGFKYGLNYPFVVSQPESASQIFAYLPQGIAYGLGISRDQVMMNGLMPYDTSADLKYITTLATAYIPSDYVSKLEMNLHMPLSDCYSNPSSPVKTLMNMINPTISILPGQSQSGASSSGWDNAAATGAATGDAAPIGGDSGNSNKVRGTSVGIGVGAVCGAAVYAAAMVYVARRYRRNRVNHKRASSVPSAGEMSQRSAGMGGFFMSGANGRGSASGSGGRGSRTSAGSSNGRSVREQGISAPIMAENSLGWT